MSVAGQVGALLSSMDAVARELHRRASYTAYTGRSDAAGMRLLRRCHADHAGTRTRVLFTRDTGMHSSGWIRNPDYERCFHLSLSPFPSEVAGDPVVDNRTEIERLWLRAFYGEHADLAWREGAKSPEGAAHEVAHWRVFTDVRWAPIRPRGEVYSSRFTPPDWRSWSEVHGGPTPEHGSAGAPT